MNYELNDADQKSVKVSAWIGLKGLLNLVRQERKTLLLATGAILLNAFLNLLGPLMIGYTIDRYIMSQNFSGVTSNAGILLGLYMIAFMASYFQTKLMGGLGQRIIFELRNTIFAKIQQLPLAFFNANKAGDLISRVNNDTDKLSQFFSQSLMQFISTIVMMTGSGIFLLVIHPQLGMATLLPALFILIFTRIISPWVKQRNKRNLESTGAMSGEIQESLSNFKVIIAFNRRDYFRKKLEQANLHNYHTAVKSGMANMLFLPVFGLFAALAQLIVLSYGIHLIMQGNFSIGLLVSYLAYATQFYNPLRQMAALWTSFQLALAGWERIQEILALQNNLLTLSATTNEAEIAPAAIEFRDVHFGYPGGFEILHHINLRLEVGKTYALVGPTGGGKTTTAAMMARLYDPLQGEVLLNGKDIRTYTDEERTEKIGYILQDPFLFSGTLKENMLYDNKFYQGYTDARFEMVLADAKLEELLSTFDEGLNTVIKGTGESLSIGQKQLIAFMRAVLRKPQLLILDEATANIDTITEQLLGKILENLAADTTLVIIAHRLNTIEKADEIYFVNAGEVVPAGSFSEAVAKLTAGNRTS